MGHLPTPDRLRENCILVALKGDFLGVHIMGLNRDVMGLNGGLIEL